MSCHATSCHVMPRPATSRHVMSCHVESLGTVTRHVMYNRVRWLSRRVPIIPHQRWKSRDGHTTDASLSTDFFHTQLIQIKYNSIKCVACHKWVHKRCSGISGRLGYVADFRCRRCLDGDSSSGTKWGRVRARCEGGVCVQILLFGWHTRFWWGCSGSG